MLLLNPDQSPELRAVDLHPDGRTSRNYEPTWRQLAAFLGTPPPWFHYALRDQAVIADCARSSSPRAQGNRWTN